MFCIKCGKQLSADARFCSACGSKVSDTDNFETGYNYAEKYAGLYDDEEDYKESEEKVNPSVKCRLDFSRVSSKCTIYGRLSRGTACIQKESI